MPNVFWFAVVGGFLLGVMRQKIIDIIPEQYNSDPLPISFFDELEFNMLKISNMKTVNREMLNNPNVKGMLGVIRYGEGTYDANGYRRMFGGKLFDSYSDHPRIVNTFTLKNGKKLSSTAAGAYQFLSSTWDETAKTMGLKDFSPENQDFGALGRIAARGALNDVLQGNFTAAIKKLGKEWASLPFSPYGQPVISLDKARDIFAANGGVSKDTTFV